MFTVRKAATDDIRLIRKMAEEVFPHTYGGLLPPGQVDYMMDWMYSPESLRRQMVEEGHIYYLAFRGDAPVGYFSLQPEGKALFHLQKLYVLPEFQGQGLGRSLFGHAISVIKELHPTPCEMRLNVNRQNRALNFYKRMGMTIVDKGDFPIGNGYFMNDYIMGIRV